MTLARTLSVPKDFTPLLSPLASKTLGQEASIPASKSTHPHFPTVLPPLLPTPLAPVVSQVVTARSRASLVHTRPPSALIGATLTSQLLQKGLPCCPLLKLPLLPNLWKGQLGSKNHRIKLSSFWLLSLSRILVSQE